MNSPMEGMENLPEEQRDALLQKIEELQVRDRSGLNDPVVARTAALPFGLYKSDLMLGLVQFENLQFCGGAVFC